MSDSEKVLPVLPLRDVVVYPYMVIPLFVGREQSIHALNQAMKQEESDIVLVAQKDPTVEIPAQDDIWRVATTAKVLQLLKLPDGTVKVLVEGKSRVRMIKVETTGEYMSASIQKLDEIVSDSSDLEALIRSVLHQFERYINMTAKLPAEVLTSLSSIDDASRLADSISAHLSIRLDKKQKLLEILDVRERLEKLVAYLEEEIELLSVEKKIRGRVKQQMEKSQREYYLNEQLKAIQKELGELDDGASEINELEEKINKAKMPAEVDKKARSELNKLKMMSAMSSEATVVRNYLEWLTSVPWSKRGKIRYDLEYARKVLDEDHYGLEKVKERILEYLAVQHRVKKIKGPILCLVGPPGVGKTSVGQSIARATGREYSRIALGGIRDEAEIRGHRRTYIGSMPGKIIQRLSKVGVKNPMILLDEIDKMATDFRGDPASAFLEVLDSEQNNTFNDHYLEVDYDLSEVMFVCTANSLNTIPAPLLDRMEVIQLSGYTEPEKVNIACQYLIPKQMKAAGLKSSEISFSRGAILDIIRYYTREAGVRGLEREIAKICRKVVKQLLSNPDAKKKVNITTKNLKKLLGVRRFRYGIAGKEDELGQVTGLAWTESGGDLLTIEAAVMPGKGKLSITGQIGDVMQESVKAAMTVVRSRSSVLGIDADTFQKCDIHIHVPEGGIPKDGPSAGVAMCTALVSVLTGCKVDASVAMTGEITLRGEVLPIGGLKEKLLAAQRGGIKTVLIPEDNRRDLEEIPQDVQAGLDIRFMKWIDEVLENALTGFSEYLSTIPKGKEGEISTTTPTKPAISDKKPEHEGRQPH
ncbi:MAG: endopeptidase La [Gammaproteobacteria bacterium]|nr:MAG: endopeptidase La [Gammaproteobacteria bacterium]